jgi:hypothetical protein
MQRLRATLSDGLDAAQREAFLDDLAETNRGRMRVLMPIMVVGHLIHVALFHVSAEEHASLEPLVVTWRQGIELAHGLALLAAVPLAWVAWRGPLRMMRWATPVAALTYLLHGAAAASIDQLKITAISPYLAYALGTAVAQLHTLRAAASVYALGLAAFVVGIIQYQADPSVLLAIIPTGTSVTVLSFALTCLLHVARRRDFVQRATIDSQRDELARLNAKLEERVHEQVAEIVTRAEQVEALNIQLRAQVRDRSAELSAALARLGQAEPVGRRLTAGDLLLKRFRIGHVLGEGGMGVVYAGTDLETGGEVAIKVVLFAGVPDRDTLHRFLREATAAAQVAHPAIVRMLHVDVAEDGTLFQVQERVTGQSLQGRLRPGKPWDLGAVCRLGATLCDALAAAHRNDVVHRDVKASNLMLVREAPGLKLFDFGIAKLQQHDAAHDETTRTGTLLGTPSYMSPEQFVAGSKAVSDRADIYAVGVLLYLLLSGHLPSESRSLEDLISEHRGGRARAAPDPRAHVVLLPGQLAALVMACLESDPRARPSAESLARALAAQADARQVASLDALEREGNLYDQEAIEAFAHTTRRS